MPIDIDIDAADLMNDVVAVERLAPPAAGARGLVAERWEPVPGSEAVPCLIALTGTRRVFVGDREVDAAAGKIVFDAEPRLGADRRIRFADPARGDRYFRAGVAVDAAEAGKVWVAEIEEIA